MGPTTAGEKRHANAQRLKILRQIILADRAVEIRQKSAARHAFLPASLANRLCHPDCTQVVIESALDRVGKSQLAGKRSSPGACRAARIRPLNLDRGVDCVHAGCCARQRSFGSGSLNRSGRYVPKAAVEWPM